MGKVTISGTRRVESIDVLRGVTILGFVNDIAGVAGTPAWMKHISPSHGDSLTSSTSSFPAFLCAGSAFSRDCSVLNPLPRRRRR